MEINGLQILFQIINFGVVFGAVSFLLYKPVIKVLDDRAKKMAEGEKAANESLRERDELEVMKKKTKTQAEKDAAKLLEKAQEEAKELKSTLTKEVKAEIKEMKEKEMKKWEAEKEGMKKDIESQVTKMSLAIASKVLGTEIDKKGHVSLINSSIKELEKAI